MLRAAKESDPDLPVVVMTAYGSIQDAVAAMKQGALDFLAKPVEPDHLRLLVERALERRRLLAENLLLREELAERRGMPVIIGESASLRQVSAALQRAAGTDTTVLLEGESGTGKELFARALHALSARADGPFVAINCAAIPEHLLESELFGYEKGAFTGADGRKIGKFELAHQGTFFLDEIGELPLALQAKMLRALEQRTFERVGGTVSIRVNVRLVAATNRNLRGAVASRRFREDLFFRLSVFPITVPPLRDRPEDIPVLARHFVARFCREMKKPVLELSQEAEEALRRYHWPGNVRELQNAVERAVILAEGTVLLPHNLVPAAPDSAGPDGDPWALDRPVGNADRRLGPGAGGGRAAQDRCGPSRGPRGPRCRGLLGAGPASPGRPDSAAHRPQLASRAVEHRLSNGRIGFSRCCGWPTGVRAARGLSRRSLRGPRTSRGGTRTSSGAPSWPTTRR